MNQKVMFLGLSCFIIGSILPWNASHAGVEPTRIAVVNMQEAMQTVKAGKDARVQLEKEISKKKAELQKEDTAIKKMTDDFQKQSLVMNDEARAKKQAELQQRFIRFQQMTQQAQEEISQKERNLLQPIINKMRTVITDLAKKKNYSLVLEKNENMVLFSEDKDDLTDEVISLFDQGGKS